MKIIEYNRQAAAEYAKKWAFGRNPAYYDFSHIGGDCTNFASQCVFAGAGIMNFTETFGWYYRSLSDRTPSWTGVEFLYNFLTGNGGLGPFAEEAPLEKLEIGDIVQLGAATGDFYHSPVVVSNTYGRILVAAHTYDCFNKSLFSFRPAKTRGIHISGVRTP